jgi:alginate O-acetyltransferase complex protein AlgI
LYTLLLVMVGWVFFRSESLSQAIQYLGSMIGITDADGVKYFTLLYFDLKTLFNLIMGCILATPIAGWVALRLQKSVISPQFNHLQPVLYGGYYSLLVSLFMISAASLAAGTYNPFIYYRF